MNACLPPPVGRPLVVAYVGNFGPVWSTENDVRVGFEAAGHTVVQLQENRVTPAEVRVAGLSADMLLWTGTWGAAHHPLEETLDTFHALAAAGIPTVTYHLDTFWPVDRGARRWWAEPMFHTGLVCTADGDWPDRWAGLGVRHRWVRPAVRHTAVGRGTFRREFACDVAFVGSDGRGYHDEWPYRRELVDRLEEICGRRGWRFRNPGGRQEKVDRGRMNDFYASAAVTVGDSLCVRRSEARYWSDRAYEAPGRGGLLVMPDLPELAADFDGLLPMYPWGDWDALEGLIERLLGDDVERGRVVAGTQRIVGERHTYAHRAAELVELAGLS